MEAITGENRSFLFTADLDGDGYPDERKLFSKIMWCIVQNL
jgi:hypothetical protein